MATYDFDRVGDILSGLLSEGAATGPAASARRLAEAWSGVVGADGAANSQPRSLRGRRLVVATSSSSWAQALQERENEVLERVARVLGAGIVAAVAFRPAGWDPCAGVDAPRPLEADPGAWESGAASSDEGPADGGGSPSIPRRELSSEEWEAVDVVRRIAVDERLADRIAGAMRASLERRGPGTGG